MLNGLKALLFVMVTAIYAVSCVKGDNPINRPDNPRNQGGVPFLGPGWTKVTIPTNCLDVFFANDTAGYLAGNGVFRSMDGGVTWTKTNAQDLEYYNLYFLNDKFGWAVSEKAIARTVDSGKTWQTNSSAAFSFSDVFFVDENTGFAAASQGVLKSTDGGVTWSQLPGSPTNPFTLYFRDAQNGFFGTGTDGFWRTTNGGTSFTKISGLPNRVYNTQFLKSDPLKGMTMGEDGKIYKTVDGGTVWESNQRISDNYFDFHFGDFNNGFVMTANMVYQVDATTATKVLYLPITNSLHFFECHFTDDLERGWVVYNGGGLYRYVKP